MLRIQAVFWRCAVGRDEPIRYVCADCGHVTTTRTGRCPSCGAWGALGAGSSVPASKKTARARVVSAVDVRPPHRLSTGIGELDRVLGGGLVPGGVVLVGGQPGIGKSTLLLQAAGRVAESGASVLYVSGEESEALYLRWKSHTMSPAAIATMTISQYSSISPINFTVLRRDRPRHRLQPPGHQLHQEPDGTPQPGLRLRRRRGGRGCRRHRQTPGGKTPCVAPMSALCWAPCQRL